MTASLNQRQALFVEHYIQNGGRGATAARAAGYKGNPQTLGSVAHENLNRPYIREAIKSRQQAIRDQVTITTQMKRQKLWAIAQESSKVVAYGQSIDVTRDAGGVVTRVVRQQMRITDARAAIEAIRELNRMDGDYAVTFDSSISAAAIALTPTATNCASSKP
ncbi:MAG: terminase small subunit [Pseudomonadales bacterium]|nr:terminase small subunit [Pseudomonadales bacterium]